MGSGNILDSGSTYAKGYQQQLALVNQLRGLGAQTDLDLPRIAVIGNQSAGKSSLVEAISGINVPRDAGTCTRVPIECRMSQTKPFESWMCQVSIRWEFDASGARQDGVQEIPFGPPLAHPKDVEMTLRRAQAAVLNPKMAVDQLMRMDTEELKVAKANQLKFSRNAICVDIKGPEMADIAFVDLPGIIQNADPDVVTLVEEVVKFHIRGNCLILVALPMSDDIENQKAMRLAREVDPMGLRTIGVLTKPDIVTTVQQQTRWLDVIEGRAHQLKHGYYCTKQPDEDQRARGITATEARAAEADFFLQTLPWVRSLHQTRFGTQNLVSNLSQLLAKIISQKIPTLAEEARKQLAECGARLAALPPPISSDPMSFVLGLVTAFREDYQCSTTGSIDAPHLVQATQGTYRTFKALIRATAPKFIPYTNGSFTPTDVAEALRFDDEDRAMIFGLVPASNKDLISPLDVRQRIIRSRTRELPGNVPYPVKVAYIRDFQKAWRDHVDHCASATLATLRRETTRLVSLRFGAYHHLQPKVARIVDDLIQREYEVLKSQLGRILKYETSPFTQNEHYLSSCKKEFLVRAREARAKSLAGPVGFVPIAAPKTTVEKTPDRPAGKRTAPSDFPQSHDDVLGDSIAANTTPAAFLVASTRAAAVPFSFGASQTPVKNNAMASINPVQPMNRTETEAEVIRGLAKLGFADLGIADLEKLRPAEEYEEELEVMAEVQAYFKVAYKRVVDYVPLAIDHDFIYAVTESLQETLIEKLGIGSRDAAEKCAAYLAEDPDVAATREELLARKRRLEKVQDELLNFGL